MNYSVLLTDYDPDRIETLSRGVAEVYRILPLDAQQRLRHGWGFLERETSAPRAAEIVAALTERGVRAQAIANDQLRQTEPPLVMLGFAADADGFTPALQDPQAASRAVRWDEIAIVAAGGFSEETMRREAGKSQVQMPSMIGLGIFLTTGIPVGMFRGRQPKNKKPVKATRFISFGQIVTTRGESFFGNPEHFDFSCLGEKKQVNASLNFRFFIAWFAERSSARLNLGARCVLGNKSLSLANYQSLHDFETELLWMINTAGSPA